MPQTPRTETQLCDFDALEELEATSKMAKAAADQTMLSNPSLPVAASEAQDTAKKSQEAASEAQDRAKKSSWRRSQEFGFNSHLEQEEDDAENGTVEVAGMHAYRAAVRRALEDEAAFGSFKQDPDYRVVLEHVWPTLGAEYLRCALRDAPGIWDELQDAVLCNNWVGAPILHGYPNIGPVSPTQLRYLKVLVDLRTWRGIPRLTPQTTVVEFGCGYGGQAQIILAAHKLASYVMIDFPEVELLALRYLESTLDAERRAAVSLYQDRSRRTARSGESFKADLFLSNYAFSELRPSLQRRYFQSVVRHCRHGYVTYNRAADAGAMPVGEFTTLLRQAGYTAKVAVEEPHIAPECYHVTW